MTPYDMGENFFQRSSSLPGGVFNGSGEGEFRKSAAEVLIINMRNRGDADMRERKKHVSRGKTWDDEDDEDATRGSLARLPCFHRRSLQRMGEISFWP